jgi:hypothetical protein
VFGKEDSVKTTQRYSTALFRLELTPKQFASLSTFLASVDNEISAPSGHHFMHPHVGQAEIDSWKFARLIKATQEQTDGFDQEGVVTVSLELTLGLKLSARTDSGSICCESEYPTDDTCINRLFAAMNIFFFQGGEGK